MQLGHDLNMLSQGLGAVSGCTKLSDASRCFSLFPFLQGFGERTSHHVSTLLCHVTNAEIPFQVPGCGFGDGPVILSVGFTNDIFLSLLLFYVAHYDFLQEDSPDEKNY